MTVLENGDGGGLTRTRLRWRMGLLLGFHVAWALSATVLGAIGASADWNLSVLQLFGTIWWGIFGLALFASCIYRSIKTKRFTWLLATPIAFGLGFGLSYAADAVASGFGVGEHPTAIELEETFREARQEFEELKEMLLEDRRSGVLRGVTQTYYDLGSFPFGALPLERARRYRELLRATETRAVDFAHRGAVLKLDTSIHGFAVHGSTRSFLYSRYPLRPVASSIDLNPRVQYGYQELGAGWYLDREQW